MIELRPFSKLASADHGWLKAKHHFSFGSHYDPTIWARLAAGVERRRDRAEHRLSGPSPPNMEIITYVREARSLIRTRLATRGAPRRDVQ